MTATNSDSDVFNLSGLSNMTDLNDIEFNKPVYSELVESHFQVGKSAGTSLLEGIFAADDLARRLIDFLGDDGLAVGRLSICSKTLYERFTNPTVDFDPWIQVFNDRYFKYMNDSSENIKWEKIHRCYWMDKKRGPARESITDVYRHKLIHRFCLDKSCKSVIKSIARDFEVVVFAAEHASLPLNDDGSGIDTSPYFFGPDSERIGKVWSHSSWSQLLSYGPDIIDHLRRLAQPGAGEHDDHKLPENEILKKVNRFLAAQALRNMYSAESLFVWKDTMGDFEVQTNPDAPGERWEQTISWVERYTILVSKIQQPLEDLLERIDINKNVVQALDDLAAKCKGRLNPHSTAKERFAELNKLLFVEQRFFVKVGDIHDYRLSLITHALETQTGNSMTLCILYSSICRRLGIKTGIIGLRDQFLVRVYGIFDGDKEDKNAAFINVSNSGRQCALKDCKDIMGDFWLDKMATPLTAKEILTKINDRLTSCHEHQLDPNRTIAPEERNPYAQEMSMPQKCLALLCKQPEHMIMPLLDKFAKDMPVLMSRGTLEFYNLIKTQQPE